MSVWVRALLGTIFSAAISLRGVKHSHSLTPYGGVAAFVLGVLTFASGYSFAATLLVFYLSSSRLTKYQASVKRRQEEEYKVGGQRNVFQVLCNGGLGTLLAVSHLLVSSSISAPAQCVSFDGSTADMLLIAFVGFYACCAGDTWASEIGSVAGGTPRLITTLRPVPPGTNGGVSFTGLMASLTGGLVVGICFVLSRYFFDGVMFSTAASPLLAFPQRNVGLLATHLGCPRHQAWVVLAAGAAGLAGSLIDSLLGAVLQATYYDSDRKLITSHFSVGSHRISGRDILSNNGVNFLSSLSTAILTPVLASWLL